MRLPAALTSLFLGCASTTALPSLEAEDAGAADARSEARDASMSDAGARDLSEDLSGSDDPIGEFCVPQVVPDPNGFAPGGLFLETGSPACGGGVCIVYNDYPEAMSLDPRDTREACEARGDAECDGLPDQALLDAVLYCTCRCGGPVEDPSRYCACPEAFSCVANVVGGSDPDLAGDYCIRIVPELGIP